MSECLQSNPILKVEYRIECVCVCINKSHADDGKCKSDAQNHNANDQQPVDYFFHIFDLFILLNSVSYDRENAAVYTSDDNLYARHGNETVFISWCESVFLFNHLVFITLFFFFLFAH